MFEYKVIPVTPFAQNCTLFWHPESKRGGVVDPGGDLHLIKEQVAEQGVVLEKILCTHGHLDHVGGVAELARELSLPIVGPHKADLFWIDKLKEQAEMFGFPEAERFDADEWLEHGDVVEVAGAKFEVLHCPGHTPGHVVFFQPDDNIALVGDVLFQGSIGRTDFPQGNHQQLIDSITTHLWALGDDVRFVPGHGKMSSFGQERASNPFVGDKALAQSR